MSIYSKIYNNLCEKKRQLKESWKPGSNLHRHHIIPRHMNGTDDEDNFTYLTIREHVIAHFLLWKIHKNPNDLRSMHMLGAELTYAQRRTVGLFCKENKIGIWGADADTIAKWKLKGVQTQMEKGLAIFNPNTASVYASLGGRVGGKRQAELGIGGHSPEALAKCRAAGGKSHTGKKWVHMGSNRTRVPVDKIQEYLDDGWKFGIGRNPHDKYPK